MASSSISRSVNTSPFYSRQLRGFTIKALITLFAFMVLVVYLLPFGNMVLVSLRSSDMLAQTQDSSILPLIPVTYTYEGKEYPIVEVPTDNGTQQWALVKKGRQASQFIDPANPDAGLIEWEGNWRLLPEVQEFSPYFDNYPTAWEEANFPRMFGNTLVIAVAGMIGTLLSCISVAYAFARFPIPGKNVLFIVLIGTIILPSQVTLIPTYAFFSTIGWVGTWLPLIVPHFFANAYNVFLLRQYFMTLPRELDEAAMIDGAGPFRVLVSVIIPQSWAAIIAVGIFHFVFAWNDFFGPLIYLLSKPELQPISVGVQIFNFQYGPHPELVQATSLMAMVLPLIIFFLAQKVFMRGIVITGVEK
ncbi:MAG: carbohydrate ABC transporter permease [Anaerolineaceae bacterium]|nr:carbohydrate ABC transporter permease [Anaerolineaceae bacterium]